MNMIPGGAPQMPGSGISNCGQKPMGPQFSPAAPTPAPSGGNILGALGGGLAPMGGSDLGAGSITGGGAMPAAPAQMGGGNPVQTGMGGALAQLVKKLAMAKAATQGTAAAAVGNAPTIGGGLNG